MSLLGVRMHYIIAKIAYCVYREKRPKRRLSIFIDLYTDIRIADLGKLLGLEQAIVIEIVVAEHEADQVVFASGVAVPVLHGRQSGVVVQKQIILKERNGEK